MTMQWNYTTIEQLLALCDEHGCSMGEIMVRREIELQEVTSDEVEARMERALAIMRDAVSLALREPQQSMGGLIGGEAIRLRDYRDRHGAVMGGTASKAVAYAMATLEVNASMGLIVAAPTAGSSGVLPGVLLALEEDRGLGQRALLDAMYTASAIGYVIARNATIAGAEGGCQAEVGAASAMAAAAAVQLCGGTPQQASYAAGVAISNLLGLVCDPIRGLVESPCQGRNGMGAVGALLAAELALAGAAPCIPLDEIIEAMYAVGRSLPKELRETALGGIATCPSASKGCGGCGKANVAKV